MIIEVINFTLYVYRSHHITYFLLLLLFLIYKYQFLDEVFNIIIIIIITFNFISLHLF